MDPNANLEEQRRIITRVLYGSDTYDAAGSDEALHDVMRLAELAEALDGWLSKGGFLPEAWKR